jgi:RNA polymerase sigma-70 factor (ECF subfamily)
MERPKVTLSVVPSAGSAAVSPGPEPSDDELMVAARTGEPAAFDRLVRRHQRRVIGYAMKFFGSEALACDIAQDVFVDLLRAMPRYRPEGHFITYLYRIALNRCRMAARSFRYEEAARTRVGVTGGAAAEIVSSADPERDRAIQRAMLRLSEKQREVLLLRFWSELKHEEIAEVVGARVGTIKSRLFGALRRLGEELRR